MLIQTELLEVCPSAAGMGYGGCQQICDQNATGSFKGQRREKGDNKEIIQNVVWDKLCWLQLKRK